MTLYDALLAFSIIFIAEFLDKTQMIVILLATERESVETFIGSYLSLLTVAGITLLLGEFLEGILSSNILSIGIGILFVSVGVFLLIKKEDENNNIMLGYQNTILCSFIAVFLAELGDKTQLAVVSLALLCSNYIHAFIGIAIAFALITSLSVLIGSKLKDIARDKSKTLSKLVGLVFILIGTLMLLGL